MKILIITVSLLLSVYGLPGIDEWEKFKVGNFCLISKLSKVAAIYSRMNMVRNINIPKKKTFVIKSSEKIWL